ncbi:MAG: acyl-CoA dehydrogenase family protein [Pirellulales bacterium]
MKSDQPDVVTDQTGQIDTEAEQQSFAETALRMSGKSDDEARRTGAIDKADDDVESLFRFKTSASPIHRAVWEAEVPVELFQSKAAPANDAADRVMVDSLDAVRRHRREGTLYNDEGKIAEHVLQDLAGAGYWGLLVDQEYGGTGCPFARFAPFLTQMSLLEPTVAGLASVHGCIGAVDPVRTFGSPEQKHASCRNWPAASGSRRSRHRPCAVPTSPHCTRSRARRRPLRRQRRETLHHQRHARTHRRPRLPDRR